MKRKDHTRHLHLATAVVAGALAALGSAPAAAATPDELEAAVRKIDRALYAQCEADVRAWLDARLAKYGDFGVFPDLPPHHLAIDDDGRAATFNLGRGGICDAGAQLFRAYEMLGDEKYLRAALRTADALLAVQQPNGHFAGGPHRVNRDGQVTVGGDRNVIRVQDGAQFRPFAYLLYAHRLTGEKKYFEAARRCADLFVEHIQHPEYGWCGDTYEAGALKRHAHYESDGGSYNDFATTDPLRMTIMMYHLTGERKYLARSAKIGQWIFDTQLGEGEVRGWCQQYKADNTPAHARGFEQPVIGPRTFNRFVGPMLTWLHGMTGDERYRKLFEETCRWMRSVEQPDKPGDPGASWARDRDELVALYARDFEAFVEAVPGLRRKYPSGGWAYQYVRDGTPIFSIRTRGAAGASFPYHQPEKWPRPGDIDQRNWPGLVYHAIQPSNRAKVQLDDSQQVLEVLQAGGLEALRDFYKGPKRLDSGQYLQARLEAARRCTDTKLVVPLRGRSLEEGVNGRVMGNYLERVRLRLARPDAPWLPAEGTLHRRKGLSRQSWQSIHTYNEPYRPPYGWAQWQYVWDARLALGQIDADTAATGGRGLETMHHYPRWDVMGDWTTRAVEAEDWMNVPLADFQ